VVADASTQRVLDVGCGPGTVALSLARYFRTVVGVDADPAMTREARAVAASFGVRNATFVCQPAEALGRVLRRGGSCVFVYGWTLSGDPVPGSPHPPPPYEALAQLLALLPRSVSLPSITPGDEAAAMGAAGYLGPTVVTVPGGEVVVSTIGDQLARLLSRSSASPSTLGRRLTAFTREATTLLRASTPTGLFAERLRGAPVTVWRRPDDASA